MERIPGLVDVKSSTEGGNPELQIRFNRERLATLGLSVQQVASVVRSKVLGDIVTDITREDRTIDIRLRAAGGVPDSADDLRNLTVARPGPPPSPCRSVAEVDGDHGAGRDPPRRRGARRPDHRQPRRPRPGQRLRDIQAALDAMTFPIGFDARTRRPASGDGDLLREHALRHPAGDLHGLPGDGVAVRVAAPPLRDPVHACPSPSSAWWRRSALLDISLSVVVLIGVILLAGIVVNNAIILVDYTNRLRARGHGQARGAQAGRRRCGCGRS